LDNPHHNCLSPAPLLPAIMVRSAEDRQVRFPVMAQFKLTHYPTHLAIDPFAFLVYLSRTPRPGTRVRLAGSRPLRAGLQLFVQPS